MRTILQELYYGHINPSERSVLTTADYKTLCKDFSDRYRSLRDTLKGSDQSLVRELDLMIEQMNAVGALESEDAFTVGFALGCRLILEVMDQSRT